MDDLTTIQEKHTAGDKVVGFDYQFYYFMYLALNLKYGEKIGFEVKDDIHIELQDGTTILYQAKHTILTKTDGTPDNLTTLDIDLWKSLSNWSDMIKSNKLILNNHKFCLVTNKSERGNTFIESLALFKEDKDIDKIRNLLQILKDKTKNKEIQSYIKNILSLGKRIMKPFLSQLSIDTGTDDIIDKIKKRIYEQCRQRNLVDAIFELLVANLNVTKYIDIKNRVKFEITFDDFNKKFGRCFKVAYEKKPLPKREFSLNLPENLEEQTFIKQLLDIEDIISGDPQIIKYTTYMLQTVNQLKNWIEEFLILSTEIDELHKEAIMKWENEFHSKYRQIKIQINSGHSIDDLEKDIKDLGIQLVDFLRKESLSLAGQKLDPELSNGYYYSLSDTPEIGWHYDWEKKYKTI